MYAAINPEPSWVVVLVAADSLEECFGTNSRHINRREQVYLPVRVLCIPLCGGIPHEVSGHFEGIIPTVYVHRETLDAHIGSLTKLRLVVGYVLNTAYAHLCSNVPMRTDICFVC